AAVVDDRLAKRKLLQQESLPDPPAAADRNAVRARGRPEHVQRRKLTLAVNKRGAGLLIHRQKEYLRKYYFYKYSSEKELFSEVAARTGRSARGTGRGLAYGPSATRSSSTWSELDALDRPGSAFASAY